MSLILKPKSFQSIGMKATYLPAVFPWADDIETVLKLKMSFTWRQIFIIVIFTARTEVVHG